MHLLDGHYEDAITSYDSLFKNYDYVFPKDAFLAAQLAAHLEKNDQCFSFLKKGIVNGLPINSILNNSHLGRWAESSQGQQLTTNLVDSLYQIYTEKINQGYRTEIVKMTKDDQYLRDKNETFLNAVVFNHKLKPRLYKKWMQQAEDQSRSILQLTKKRGFPSHKIIGTHHQDTYSKFGTNLSSSYATVILFHFDFAWEIFKDELPAQLEQGNITPKQFALIRDFATRNYMMGEVKDPAYQDYEYFIRWTQNKTKVNEESRKERANWIKENKTSIDKSRTAIGLVPYDYGMKKKQMQFDYYDKRAQIKTENLPYFDLNYWGWD